MSPTGEGDGDQEDHNMMVDISILVQYSVSYHHESTVLSGMSLEG